jgi:hypothetical protein
MMRKLQSVLQKDFMPYGDVLELPPDNHDKFAIISKESKAGWRLAVFRYSNHDIGEIECHPESLEL